MDIVELAAAIGEQSIPAADRFLDATTELLSSSPGIGGLYGSTNERFVGLRVFPVRGFRNHLIFYREREHGIEIIRVLHGASDVDAALVND